MATKKITELPFIVTISGSSVFDNPSVNSVVPLVLYGTTNQITVENFSKFTNLYAAQTGSQNIFTQNQWFNTTVSASTINVGTLGVGGNTTIAGTLDVTGNGTIGGNLAVAGRITAEEFYTEITTASVIYASGSTKFGDDTGDKHEFTGSINVSGSVIYNGVILTNIDANTIQRLQQATASIQQATASLNTFTASQDDRNFILSQVTGSFAGEIGGLEAYTASLKTAAIVSSSTQILNYNIFATTGSNTFRANQAITGSLSISAGEFNVTTGSGNMTSSLIFDHTQNDGVTLGLRHNDRLSVADHIFNVNVWAAGVYTSFVRNGVPYSILNVEAFDDNKIYLYRDTRLYNKSLVIDNNLTVQNGVVIGSGSLLVNGVITGSILATNGVISSSNQLFELNQFTASQDGRNFTLSQVTGSLIGITNGLMAFTASLDNTYATDAQLYQLYQATRSLELHSGSMIGVTNGLMAFTAALDSTYATDAQLYQLYAETASIKAEIGGIELYTASLKAASIVSSSTQIQNYDVFALNSNLYESTGSIKGEIVGIEAYTASLKAAAIVSSSQQVQNYFTFAKTGSANTFYGTQTISGSLIVSSSAIFSSGSVGIGITPEFTLDVNGDIALNRNNKLQFTGGVVGDRARSYLTGDGNNNIFVYGPSSNLITTFGYTGDVTVANGNLIMGTAGKGIDFSATSNGSGTTSSELLNDYEEGTFTPTFTGVNLTINTYGNRAGFYTKVGRLVTVTINIMTDSVSVIGSEAVKIGGLPFTSNSTAESSNSANIFNSARWTALPPICGQVGPNSTEIELHSDRGATGAGTDPTTVKTGDMATGSGNRNMVRLTATYFTS